MPEDTAAAHSRWHWIRRRGLLVIFVVAYLMMTLLIVQQERVILQQSALIRDLFRDSLELNALKIRQAQNR